MSRDSSATVAFGIDEFLGTLTAQLDQAQDTLAVKARTGRPLTWALKDLALDLRVFVEMGHDGEIKMRSAKPNEEGASTLKLNLTTITRPMVEENTVALQDDTDPRLLSDLGPAARLSPEEQQRLRRLGVRTAGQLKRLSTDSDPHSMQAMVGIPVTKLQAILAASARPAVLGHDVMADEIGDPVIRIHGANLFDGVPPEVKLQGEPVEVLEAQENRLLVRPMTHHKEGQVEVLVGGQRTTGFFRLPTRGSGATDGGDERGDHASTTTSTSNTNDRQGEAGAA